VPLPWPYFLPQEKLNLDRFDSVPDLLEDCCREQQMLPPRATPVKLGAVKPHALKCRALEHHFSVSDRNTLSF
jgi:hypothetical protein